MGTLFLTCAPATLPPPALRITCPLPWKRVGVGGGAVKDGAFGQLSEGTNPLKGKERTSENLRGSVLSREGSEGLG